MKKKGIKLAFIEDSNIFNQQDFSMISKIEEIPTLSDEIRYRSGHIAYVNKEKAQKPQTAIPVKLEFLEKNKLKIIANKKLFTRKRLQNGVVKEYFETNLWKSFLLGLEYDGTAYSNLTKVQNGFKEYYTDHFTSIDVPYNLKEERYSNHGALNFFNREFHYDFFSPSYESVTTRISTKEYTLPSYYSFKRYLKNKEISDSELAQISLGGEIQSSLYNFFFNLNTPEEFKKRYFSEYGDKYDTDNAKLAIKDSYVSPDNILSSEEISEYNEFANAKFPFYCKLQFSNPGIKEILSSLKESGLDSKFIEDYISKKGFGFLNFTFSKETGENFNESINAFDFKYWYDNMLKDIINADISKQESFSLNYKIIELANKLKNISKEKFRSLQEVYNGKQAHSEVLMFKIEKYFNNPKGTPLQTFYFYPSDDSIINFFDTQIKYGRNYAYKIYAVTAVFGNQYSFSNNYLNLINDKDFIRDLENGEFVVNIENTPSIKLLEIPYFEFSGASLEKPTDFPNVFFETYEGKKDRVRIKGEMQKTENLSKPIILESSDSDYYDLLVNSQENEKERSFYFDSDKQPKKLQIYRTTTKPNFYSDLSGKLHFTLPINSSEFNLIDDIVPNIKYYYVFRFLNDHDNPSLPTDVYEFELKTEDQVTYKVIKKIDLKKKIYSEPTKVFRRYLQIIPTLPQTIINNSQKDLESILKGQNLNNISLGINEKIVWNKLFKLRITSKKSSKKIDLNFKFIEKTENLVPTLLVQQNSNMTDFNFNPNSNSIYVGIL